MIHVRKTVTRCVAMLIAVAALPVCTPASAAPTKPVRILFLTQSFGFKHGSVTRKPDKDKPDAPQLAPAERAMTALGVSSGLFRVDCTQDAAKDFTKDNLQNYDIVMFYTTGPRKNWPVSDETFDYFFNTWLKQPGHGFIGAHSAADTMADYKPYWDMIGGSFDGHPWHAGDTVTITVHDQDNPISKPWGDEFTIKDEIYQFKNWQPEKVHLLMSMNMEKTSHKEVRFVPVAWCKEYGEGKCFHMSLGHNEDVWTNPKYMDSMLGGIKWILGLEKADASPNPRVSAEQEFKSVQAAVRDLEQQSASAKTGLDEALAKAETSNANPDAIKAKDAAEKKFHDLQSKLEKGHAKLAELTKTAGH